MVAAERRPELRIALVLAILGLLAGSTESALAKPVVGAPGCQIFPKTNVWNRRIDSLPVRSDSATLIAAIGIGRGLHPDFGSYKGYGIPISVATKYTPKKTVSFRYKSESDKGPYPIPQASSGRPARTTTSSSSTRTPASSTSCSGRRSRPAAGGRPVRARSGACARTSSDRTPGRAPTPPACRSCPAWSATTSTPRA